MSWPIVNVQEEEKHSHCGSLNLTSQFSQPCEIEERRGVDKKRRDAIQPLGGEEEMGHHITPRLVFSL